MHIMTPESTMTDAEAGGNAFVGLAWLVAAPAIFPMAWHFVGSVLMPINPSFVEQLARRITIALVLAAAFHWVSTGVTVVTAVACLMSGVPVRKKVACCVPTGLAIIASMWITSNYQW
jgi:hypothetical protein